MVFLAFYHGIHHRKFTTILVGIFSNNLLYLWLQILKLNLSGHFVAPDSLKQITTFSMKLWSPGDSPTPQEAIAAARCTVLICKDSWKLLEIAGGFWGEDLGPSQIWAWERLQLGLAASPIVIMVQWKMKGIYLKGVYLLWRDTFITEPWLWEEGYSLDRIYAVYCFPGMMFIFFQWKCSW